MAGIGRAAFYMLGQSELFMLVYVDDLLWITRDKMGIEKTILIIYFMTVLGLPFAWKKFKGGVDLAWVGFEISLAVSWACQWRGRNGWSSGLVKQLIQVACAWQICRQCWAGSHLD